MVIPGHALQSRNRSGHQSGDFQTSENLGVRSDFLRHPARFNLERRKDGRPSLILAVGARQFD